MEWMYARSIFDVPEARSLCTYFWRVLLSPLALVVSAGVIAGLAAAALFIMVGIIGAPLAVWMSPSVGTILAGAFWFVSAVLVDGWLAVALLEHFRPGRAQRVTGAMEVAFAYLAAKKRRVCPFIEYEN
jgi:hypothetical protein